MAQVGAAAEDWPSLALPTTPPRSPHHPSPLRPATRTACAAAPAWAATAMRTATVTARPTHPAAPAPAVSSPTRSPAKSPLLVPPPSAAAAAAAAANPLVPNGDGSSLNEVSLRLTEIFFGPNF